MDRVRRLHGQVLLSDEPSPEGLRRVLHTLRASDRVLDEQDQSVTGKEVTSCPRCGSTGIDPKIRGLCPGCHYHVVVYAIDWYEKSRKPRYDRQRCEYSSKELGITIYHTR